MKKLIYSVAVIALMAGTHSTTALAATDGSLSTTASVGDFDVTANIPELVRVSGLNDLTFDLTVDDLTNIYHSRIDRTDKFCVYSNVTSAGNYTITVDGLASSASGAPFALEGPGSEQLPFAVWLTDDFANQFTGTYWWPGRTASYSTTSGNLDRPTDINCSNVAGENAQIRVGITQANALSVPAGAYNGTLTVTVAVP